MRKWKCVSTRDANDFTIGKIYESLDDGSGIVGDDGYDYEHKKPREFIDTKFEEVTQFTKADLKPCMVVVRRDKSVCGIFQLRDSLKLQTNLGMGNCDVDVYSDDLTSFCSEYDITQVYGFSDGCFDISIENRPLLWERIEKTPTQLKLEELENKQREIADEIKKVREEL